MFITKKSIPTYKQRKEAKMTKTKNRTKKMTFQKQPRSAEHRLLSENDKYIMKIYNLLKKNLIYGLKKFLIENGQNL